MKIISNKQLEDYKNQIADLTLQNLQKEKEYRKNLDFYSNLLNDLCQDLNELNRCLKQKIGKEKIKLRVQDMIIKIGGR